MFRNLKPFFPKRWILYGLITFICSGAIALFEVVSISLLPFFFGETGASNDGLSGNIRLILDQFFKINSNSFQQNLFIFCIIFMSKNLIAITIRFIANTVIMAFSAIFEKKLFNYLLATNIDGLNTLKKSDMNQIFAIEIQNARTYFLTPFTNFVIEASLAVSLLGLLIFMSDANMIIAFIILFVTVAISIYGVSEISNFLGKRRVKFQEKFLEPLKNFYEGYLQIRSYGQSERYSKNFWAISKKLNFNRAKAATISASSSNIVEILLIAFVPIAFSLVFTNYSDVNLTALATYSLIFYRLYPSLSRMTNYLTRMKNGYASLQFISDFNSKILSFKTTPDMNVDILEKSKNLMEVRDISYTIEGLQIFKNFSIDIPKSGIVQIEGKNGSGKSTLINILLGFVAPQSGAIKRIKNFNDLKISYGTQLPFLESATIKQNIFFDKKKESNDFEYLLEILDFKDFYNQNKNYYVGDGGLSLSGGQKQKVNIIRALLGEPDILVLDEPYAALDKKTKTKLSNYLKDFSKNHLLIIVSHENILGAKIKIPLESKGNNENK